MPADDEVKDLRNQLETLERDELCEVDVYGEWTAGWGTVVGLSWSLTDSSSDKVNDGVLARRLSVSGVEKALPICDKVEERACSRIVGTMAGTWGLGMLS
jgi:hypothetical protein